MPDDRFGPWLKRHYVALIAAVSAVVASISTLIPQVKELLAFLSPWETVIPAALHLVVLVALVALMTRLKSPVLGIEEDEDLARALAAVRQFKKWWTLVIFAWFFLYLVLTAKEACSLMGLFDTEPNRRVWLDISMALNNVQTLVLALCFLVLSEASLERTESADGVRFHEAVPWPLATMMLVILTAAQLLLGHFANLPYFYLALASGLCASVALALFVGRLESKYIQVSKGVFPLFYLYAAIQVLFGLFDDTGTPPPYASVVRATIVGSALALKLLLFAFVYWCYESGRLLFYVHRVHVLQQSVAKDWEGFVSSISTTRPRLVPAADRGAKKKAPRRN